jgi:putative membrane protein
MRLLRAIVINAIALFVTTIVPGITYRGNILMLLVCGAVLGLFNMIVRPIAVLLSLPLLILSLGLFFLVLNGLLLWLASFVLPDYTVSGLIPGILGALVMAIANWAMEALFGDKDKD